MFPSVSGISLVTECCLAVESFKIYRAQKIVMSELHTITLEPATPVNSLSFDCFNIG